MNLGVFLNFYSKTQVLMNKQIVELQKNQPHKVEFIKNWLSENQNYFYLLLNENNCRKWSKWLEDKSTHIYPCVCPIRNQDCIFIETYYKLAEVMLLYQKEEYFKLLVKEYNELANNKNDILEWHNKHKNVASELHFDFEISIMIQLEPFVSSKIKLDENEFKNIIEFQNIFNELEYNQIIKS